MPPYDVINYLTVIEELYSSFAPYIRYIYIYIWKLSFITTLYMIHTFGYILLW